MLIFAPPSTEVAVKFANIASSVTVPDLVSSPALRSSALTSIVPTAVDVPLSSPAIILTVCSTLVVAASSLRLLFGLVFIS